MGAVDDSAKPEIDSVPDGPHGTAAGIPAPSEKEAASGPQALVGTMLSGRYKIERLIGEGGMGAVYQAEHTHMRKRLAIKVLHPEMSRMPEVVARFEREAMAAAHIEHPNVAAATDFGKLDDGSFFLVLEFVEGASLREAIALGRLDVGRALRILRQIAAALQRAHALGIVHRDLKPENVMLIERAGDPDFVKVLDFGIAKVPVGDLPGMAEPAPGSAAQPVLTQLGMVYGTPEYMAPEQALGQPVDARADLYAVGVITYEMLTGVRPFEHASKVTLLGMHVTAPVPPMVDKAPDSAVPPDVEAIVLKLLAKDATHRFADAKELIDAIDTVWSAAYGQIPGPVPSQVSLPLGLGAANARSSLAGVGPTSLAGLPSGSFSSTTDRLFAFVSRVPRLLKQHAKAVAISGAAVGVFASLIIFATVLAGGAKRGSGAESDGAATSLVEFAKKSMASSDSKLDEEIGVAAALVEKGDYATGIAQLAALEETHPDRADIHRALEKGYIAKKDMTEAMREGQLWLKADPAAAGDLKLAEDVRNVAIGREASDDAFTLLETSMGSVGADILYDIAYGQSGAQYPLAAARARKALGKTDVRSRASAALAITLDLRTVSGCENKKALLSRARDLGDARTLAFMRSALMGTGGCGFLGTRDCYGCMHKDGSLSKAIAGLEERVHKP